MDVSPPPVSEGPEPFEYPSSNTNYYTFVIVLLVVVVVVGVALFAITRFTSSIQNTLNSAVSVNQKNYENPFVTQAQAYQNPFSDNVTSGSYQNPFSQ